MKNTKNIDSYISSYPNDIQRLLKKMRAAIKKSAQAKETISYGIPTFVLNGTLVHFGAFSSHIGFFPTSSGVAEFKKELKNYKTSKGTVRFLFDAPLPLSLVSKIVKFRVKENLKKWK